MNSSPESLFSDQLWRLRNLYSCRKEGAGVSIPFRPRAEQEVLYRHLIDNPRVPAYVIKSRRLGISTAVDTMQADCAVFERGFRGVIIDQTQADATKKMVEIVRFAVKSLPREITDLYALDKENDSELRLRLKNEEQSQDSVIYALTGNRGGDCSMLHVSEWGPIAALDPERSREIRTGAFPAARLGRRVVETTWYGGKGGDLWEMIKPILEADPNGEGVIYFFPWHSDPEAIRTAGMVTPEIEHYFRELAGKVGKSFNQDQKKWYAAKKIEQGIFVKREYPSTLEEAFSAPIEGSIYGDVIGAARADGRIAHFEWDRDCPIFSFWDIGWSDSTTIWAFQMVGQRPTFIHHIEKSGKTAAEMVHELNQTGLPIARHFLPHDARKTDPKDGKTYEDALKVAGLVNTTIIPRTTNIWVGINALRSLIPRAMFRLPQCEAGVTALEAYRKKPVTSGGTVSDEPLHDWSSHSADAARYVAEALQLGLVNTSAAKRFMDAAPRYPDGSSVNSEHAMEIRQKRRGRAMALSGPTL